VSQRDKERADAGPDEDVGREGERLMTNHEDLVGTACLPRLRFREYTRQELLESGALTITIEEARHFLRLGRGAAYECVRNGEIPSLALGRKRLVPVPKLLQLLGAEGENTGERKTGT